MIFRQLIVALLLSSARSMSLDTDLIGSTETRLIGSADAHVIGSADVEMSVDAMKEIFARSEEVHQRAMEGITSNMSVAKALDVIGKGSMNATNVAEIKTMVLEKSTNLRKQPRGYSGLDGARKMLNDMIFESLSKYDNEVAKCTEYYFQQRAAIRTWRTQTAPSNYIAANSRALILDSQATINKCEVDIPTRKLELKQHLLKCKHELYKMKVRLKIILGDIAIMTVILKMTDCDKKSFVQRSVMRCKDPCTGKSFITFKDEELKKTVSQLQSSVSHDLTQETFQDLFEGVEGLQEVEMQQSPIINKTKFSNPPVPRTPVPMNPCSDPYAGAPSAADKRAAKCILSKGQCYKLQERFLLIQSGIEDERDELLQQISMMEHFCEETKKTLETTIANDEDMLANAQTKLAAATEKEATAGETARMTAAENDQLNTDLVKQMKTCSNNYIAFESELCALKKIRGELFKLKGGGHSAFFQDCEVSKWDPEECSKKCGKGVQKLTRSVLTHPQDGARCLPLAAMKSCNQSPCPVDCKLSTWSGWSKCSAECGGGVSQRLREVKRAMRYNGAPCGATSQSISCNAQACEKDCELSDWTKFSKCSKDCDGGTKKRVKFIKQEAEGEGECAGEWSLKRLQYKACNMKRCMLPAGEIVLHCNKTLDIVLLIDGSGSLGSKGWKAEIKAAKMFVDAFSGSGGDSNMAVVLYSGPRTWGGVFKCTGKNTKGVDMEKTCGIKMVTHFNKDLKKVKNLIEGLTWPKGSTLTSLALLTAKTELSLGRKNAHGTVVVFTDGRPLSYRKTGLASHTVRKSARLIWVPVTKYAPLKKIKEWATRRWQENTVIVKSFKDLEKPIVITRIVANICPKKNPKLKFTRR